MPGIERDLTETAREALATGELLTAFDAATAGLETGGDAAYFRYVQVLALARMGEFDRAQRLYDAHVGPGATGTDALALGARLSKDRAWAACGAERTRLLSAASAAYEAVYRRTGDAFPAINAASLAYLADDRDRAAALARLVLAALGEKRLPDYYDAVTAAEAHLLLGDEASATRQALVALTLDGCDHGARSTTSRQFARLNDAGVPAAAVLDLLRPPPVITFCGHLFAEHRGDEAVLQSAVAAELDRTGACVAYGALGCGADIVVAEVVLARGGELHVVLPFGIEDFIRASVATGGDSWLARFHRCLDGAREVIIASEASALGDDRQFEYGSMLSMGYARLRAAHLGTRAIQLALWDGKATTGLAGTSADVRRWRHHGGDTVVVPLDRSVYPPPAAAAGGAAVAVERVVRAMIFTDFAGFSKIDERALPDFWRIVMGTVAAVVERHRAHVKSCNTWGDAVYVVTDGATPAAAIALDIQNELARHGLDSFGAGSGMRVSAHLGAVYEARDPVTGLTTFYGHEVNKAARIEPVTLVGEVYVTRAFAAVLEMETPAAFDLSYVGRIALAKQFGTFAMYRLSRPPVSPSGFGDAGLR